TCGPAHSRLPNPHHPVPQLLTAHAANLRRLFPRGALEHGRNRYQPSRLRSVFRSLGKPANLAGGVVRPHRNSMAHGKPPQFAILNHASIDSGIPRESATQRIGIRQLPLAGTATQDLSVAGALVTTVPPFRPF